MTRPPMKKRQALLKLHIAVLLAGATGLFGRLISLQEIPLVWYRILITTLLLIPILAIGGRLQKIPSRAALRIGGAGMFLGIHWVLFYASIRASNVSIGVLCYALIGFYTAVLDPLVNRRRFDWKELVFSAMTLLGLLLIYSFDSRYRVGIAIGALSSLFAAFFSMTTKKLTGIYDYPSSTFVLYEMIGGLACLTVALPFFTVAPSFYNVASPFFTVAPSFFTGLTAAPAAASGVFPFSPEVASIPASTLFPSSIAILVTPSSIAAVMLPSLRDLGLLLVLAGICTIGQYLLQFDALKEVSAFTVNLTYNLEPIYSIIFAMLLFGEARELNFSFYLGLAIIIAAVLLQNLSVRAKT